MTQESTMIRLLQRLRSEKGQALPIVLAMLAIGGLTIAVNLNYATTSLSGSGTVNEDVKGIYAASAGVENALWSLKGGTTPPTQLQNVNQMTVNMTTVNKGTYTFYLGGLFEPGDKPGVLTVSGNLSSVGGDRYLYTITVVRTAEPGGQTIHIGEVGARLPIGYSYDDSATRSDNQTIGTGNPVTTQDSAGAYLLQFQWTGGNKPEIKKEGGTFILIFYITGTGSLDGKYAWIIADPTSYGLYGEITGTWYQITATAVRPAANRTTAKIIADIVKRDDGTISIISWQITK